MKPVHGKAFIGKEFSRIQFDDDSCHYLYEPLPNGSPHVLSIGPKASNTTEATIKICEEKAQHSANVQKIFLFQRDSLIGLATDIFTEALQKGQLKAAPLFMEFYPRGCSSKEWQVEGDYDNFHIAILGDAKGIKLFKIFEKGESIFQEMTEFTDAKFKISIENTPTMPSSFRSMLNAIFAKLQSLSFLGSDPLHHTNYALYKYKEAELKRSLVEEKLYQKVEECYPNEVGGLYFEGNGVSPTWREVLEGDSETLNQIPANRFFDKKARDSAQMSDYHTHPPAGKNFLGSSFPSDMDFDFVIYTAFQLDQLGYQGKYDDRVITGLGTFIITPNMTLLQNNPDLFYERARDIRLDGFRLSLKGDVKQSDIDKFIARASNAAFKVEFSYQKTLNK